MLNLNNIFSKFIMSSNNNIKKLALTLSIFFISTITACQNQQAYYQTVDPFDYKESAEYIIDLSTNANDKDLIEAAKLNSKLSEEKSLSKKAAILVKINQLTQKNQENQKEKK